MTHVAAANKKAACPIFTVILRLFKKSAASHSANIPAPYANTVSNANTVLIPSNMVMATGNSAPPYANPAAKKAGATGFIP